MTSPHGQRFSTDAGVSFLELVATMALILVATSLAAASWLTLRAEARELGAARYLAARLGEQRAAAVRGGVSCGFLFARRGTSYVFQPVVDGNGNGLRSDDVATGVDRLLDASQSLDDVFPGVDFGVARPVPAIEGEGPALAEGADPVRIGSSSFLSFAPAGTGSSGTLYLATRTRRQLAVRVFGTTGRVRVFEFSPARGQWVPR